MPILLFGGIGTSRGLLDVQYQNDNYVKNNFIKKLKKMMTLLFL